MATPRLPSRTRGWGSARDSCPTSSIASDRRRAEVPVPMAASASGSRSSGTWSTYPTAGSARDALGLIEAWAPDVLVSDIGLPQDDGYALIRTVRARHAGPGGRIPALALTAYARAEDRARALTAGYQAHLAKPVDLR